MLFDDHHGAAQSSELRPFDDISAGHPTEPRYSSESIRVVVVDDNFVVRRGLQSSLELDPSIIVVGEGSNGDEAIELARDLVPDVILMDIRMPLRDGIAATEIISDDAPSSKVLMLTWSEDPEHLRSAVLAGAKGYLVHGRFSPERLAEAVRVVHEGGALITPMLAPALLDFVRESAQGQRGRSAPGSILTPREIEVLEYIVAGKSNREIAEALYIEEKTVKNHVSNIYSKLHLKNRYEAITRGRDHLR
ncbi:MAG TPA: response regulator transcription factor [Thermomicrobiales bacterium]|nr:response regulator transcription factor [Thermomicrobiales bacterium]